MGKIKTVVMGDLEAEETAREKAQEKREQKKIRHSGGEDTEPIESKTGAIATLQHDKKVTKKPESKYHFEPGKKYAAARSLVENKNYSLSDAIDLVKKTSYSKFDGSVEAHINTTDKNLRGNVNLPHGTGKEIKVRIADDALIANPVIDFDVLVASPEMMPKLAKIAKILGPKGLMPNPKTNTISNNPEELALSLSKSQSWKTQNDFPIIHSVIGKVSFETKKLEENFAALTKSIGKDKIRSVFLKATMGPAVRVEA